MAFVCDAEAWREDPSGDGEGMGVRGRATANRGQAAPLKNPRATTLAKPANEAQLRLHLCVISMLTGARAAGL